MEVNEHLVKVQGTSAIPIENGLGLGDDVTLLIEGTVVKILAEDNQDGTQNLTYVVKGVLAYDQVPPDPLDPPRP